LWTLLEQSPTPGKALVSKAIIVAPSSLVRNWDNEIKKWLGGNRISTLTIDKSAGKDKLEDALRNFVSGAMYHQSNRGTAPHYVLCLALLIAFF
jgi:DNA repair and recombination RAD54-like protein